MRGNTESTGFSAGTDAGFAALSEAAGMQCSFLGGWREGIIRLGFGAGLLCAAEAAAGASLPGTLPPAIAIEHVTILPMTAGDPALPDGTVIVIDRRIQSVGPAGASALPPGTLRVDGTGKWLMPSLVDSHVHLLNDRMGGKAIPVGTIDDGDLFAPYVANGVLQVINMGAMSEAIGQRFDVESGRILGPHIALGAMVDGSPPVWPWSRVADTAEDGRQVVRDIKQEGYDFVKTYSHLKLDVFTAIVDEARRQGLKAGGHIPGRGLNITEQFFQPNYTLVAHAEEFAYQSMPRFSDDDIARYVALARRSGIWLESTLTASRRIYETSRDVRALTNWPNHQYLNPLMYDAWTVHNRYTTGAGAPKLATNLEKWRKVVDFNERLIRAFDRAGIPILPGTDVPIPGQVEGFSLHDELEELARVGMANETILQSATRLPMVWLGVEGDRGTIEAGKRADLLLLDADPRVNVANTRRIAAVIDNGRYLDRNDLAAMLSALAIRYAAKRPALAQYGRSAWENGGLLPDDD